MEKASGKKLLIIVDMQNDFIGGTLGFAGAESLVPRVAKKIRAAKNRGDMVAYTMDTHGTDYLKTTEGGHLPVTHCVKGTDGWALAPALEPLLGDCTCFEKEAFGSAALFDYLREENFSSIELAGLVSYICVLSNAALAKAACPMAEVFVDACCTAGPDSALHEKALDVLGAIHVNVTNRGLK